MEFDQTRTRAIELDDALELVLSKAVEDGNVSDTAEEMLDCVDEAFVFDGPVRIGGDFELEYDAFHSAAVIFDGNLSVDGILQDNGADDCVVIVLGDLDAAHMICTTNWLVTGRVRVAGALVAWGTEDRQFEHDGGAEAALLVEHGYWVDAEAKTRADDVSEGFQRGDGAFDFEAISEALKEGRSVV